MSAVFTRNAVQTVQPNQPALLDTAIPCPFGWVAHQNDSGIITLNTPSGRPFARYLIIAKANIAVPDGSTVQPISMAIASSGGVLTASRAIVTPAAVGDFFNATCVGVVTVSCRCCDRISIINDTDIVAPATSPIPIDIQNLVVVVDLL